MRTNRKNGKSSRFSPAFCTSHQSSAHFPGSSCIEPRPRRLLRSRKRKGRPERFAPVNGDKNLDQPFLENLKKTGVSLHPILSILQLFDFEGRVTAVTAVTAVFFDHGVARSYKVSKGIATSASTFHLGNRNWSLIILIC